MQQSKYTIHRKTKYLHICQLDSNLIMLSLWLGRAKRDWAIHCVRRGACLLLTQRGTAHLQLKDPLAALGDKIVVCKNYGLNFADC